MIRFWIPPMMLSDRSAHTTCVLPHFDTLTHVVILVSSAFIFQRFAEVWYSVFVKLSSFKKFAESSWSVHRSVFAESSKAFILQKFAVKFYFVLSLHIFQHGSSLSLENVCDSWCMHQTGFSSAAVVPQSKFTELCSSAAVVSQSKSTELCSSDAVVPESKSTELCSLVVPLDHDLWYFRHRTNEHFNSMLFIRKNL